MTRQLERVGLVVSSPEDPATHVAAMLAILLTKLLIGRVVLGLPAGLLIHPSAVKGLLDLGVLLRGVEFESVSDLELASLHDNDLVVGVSRSNKDAPVVVMNDGIGSFHDCDWIVSLSDDSSLCDTVVVANTSVYKYLAGSPTTATFPQDPEILVRNARLHAPEIRTLLLHGRIAAEHGPPMHQQASNGRLSLDAWTANMTGLATASAWYAPWRAVEVGPTPWFPGVHMESWTCTCVTKAVSRLVHEVQERSTCTSLDSLVKP